MNFHLHYLRKNVAWLVGGAFLLGPMVFAYERLPKPDEGLAPMVYAFDHYAKIDGGLAPVSGRVMIGGRPVHDAIVCFDTNGGDHAGFCSVRPDGTYRLKSTCLGQGVAPGRYKVHVYARTGGSDIPKQYQLSETSGVVVDVRADWNEVDLDLQ